MSRIKLKEVNRLAIPALLTGIAEPLISIADTAIIGKMEEGATIAQGAVGLATSVFLLIIWVLSQTRSALAAIVSQYLGKMQLTRIISLVGQGIWMNILIGMICLIGALFFLPDIFQLYLPQEGTAETQQVKQLAENYFEIRAIGFPLSLVTLTMFGVFRGLQNTKWAMIISLIGGGVNLFLDIVLVYGINGWVDALGVEGAAWASLIAQLIMFIISGVLLIRNTPFGFKLILKVNPEFRNLLLMSLNLMIRTVALNIAVYLANRFAIGYGIQYISAHTILVNIWLFTSFFIDGYSNAGSAIAGRLYGSKDFKALEQLTIDVIRTSIWIAIGLGLILGLTYPWMGSWFSRDPDVIEAFNSVFWVLLISLPINSVAYVLDGVFKGLGKAVLLRNVLLFSTFIGFVPAIYALNALGLGLHAVWISFAVWMCCRAGGLWYHFRLERNLH